MSDNLEKLQSDMEHALKEFRGVSSKIDELEKKGAGVAELKEKMEKADKAMEAYDEANQKLVEKNAKAEREAEELQKRIAQLEAKQIKLATTGDPATDLAITKAAEIKAAETFMRKGMQAAEAQSGLPVMTADEISMVKKYMSTDVNPNGGFLIDQAYDDMIIKPITEMDPIRSVANIKKIDANSIQMTLRASLVTSYWTGEGESFTESQSTYSRPEIPVHSVTTKTLITNRLLLASRFNMDNEIMSDFRESTQQLVGASYVDGNGVNKPRGFLDTTAAVPTTNAGGSSTFDYDDLIELSGQLKDGYNGAYGMNRSTLTHVRKLQDGAGSYIFTTGDIKGGIPNQIAGDPYIVIPTMANIATNAKPVVYADWRRFYTCVDSWQAIMLRNPYKVDGQVQFSTQAWFGGDVVLPEAGVLLVTVA